MFPDVSNMQHFKLAPIRLKVPETIKIKKDGKENDYEFKKEVRESFDDFQCPDRDDPKFFARDEIEDRKTRALVEMCAVVEAEALPPPRT